MCRAVFFSLASVPDPYVNRMQLGLESRRGGGAGARTRSCWGRCTEARGAEGLPYDEVTYVYQCCAGMFYFGVRACVVPIVWCTPDFLRESE